MLKVSGGFLGKVPVLVCPLGMDGPKINRVSYAAVNQQKGVCYFPAYPPFLAPILEDLKKVFGDVEFSDKAKERIAEGEKMAELQKQKFLDPAFKFKTLPFAHQIDSLIYALYNPRNGLLLDCGLGKTKIAIDLVNYLGIKTLVLCPAFLVNNWVEEIATHSSLPLRVMALNDKNAQDKKDKISKPVDADMVIVGYETAAIYYEEIFKNFNYDMVIADECFGPETMVDTEQGPKRIDQVKVGERILNAYGVDEVSAVTSRILVKRVVVKFSGKEITCSCNHPWLTYRGWVPAEQLIKGDILVTTKEAMCLVQGKFRGSSTGVEKYPQTQEILREILLSEMAHEAARSKEESIHKRKGGEGWVGSVWETSAVVEGKDVESEPDVGSEDSKKICQHSAEDEAQTPGAGRKWAWANRARVFSSEKFRAWVGRALCSSYKEEQRRELPIPLQAGRSFFKEKVIRRSGWFFPRNLRKEGVRQEENQEAKILRVDGITIQEQGSYAGNPEGRYYDLTVKTHPSFSVGGALVHNCHKIKNIKSKRTKAALALSQKAHRRIGMSGTMVLNSPTDLYSQLKFLSPQILNADYYSFCQNYITYSPYNKHIPVGVKNLDTLNAKVRRHTLRYKKEDCLDLPTRHMINKYVEISPEQKKMYNDILSDQDLYLDDGVISKEFKMVTMAKLSQLTGGFLYLSTKNLKLCNGCHNLMNCVDHGVKPYTKQCSVEQIAPPTTVKRFKKNPKLEMMLEVLEEILVDPDNKVIIWAQALEELKMIEEVLTAGKIKYVRVADDPVNDIAPFNKDPDVRVMISNISKGVGFTANAANYVIYYSLTYSLEHWAQSVDRNYRIGQKRPVTVYRLLAKGTVDQRVVEALDNKVDVVESLLNNLECARCPEMFNCVLKSIQQWGAGCILTKKKAKK